MCLDIQLKILIVSNIQYQRLVPTVPSMTFNNSKFVLFTTPWQIDVIYNLYLAIQVHVFSKRSKIQIPGPLSPDEKWTFSYLCFSFDFHGPICNECWFSSLRSLWSLIYRSPDLIKIKIANSNLWYPGYHIPPGSSRSSAQSGDIDVGDGCWRQNVLMTSLRCWWPI